MEITKDSLQNLYQQTETDELLKLHSQGTLTDLAYNVLETELTRRGITPPPRQIFSDENWQSTNSHDYWLGKQPLFKAWIMLGVIGNFVIMIFLFAFAKLIPGLFGPGLFGKELGNLIMLFTTMPYFVFAWVSIWRCASNTHSKFWFILARGYVALWALPWILIFAFSIKFIIDGIYRSLVG